MGYRGPIDIDYTDLDACIELAEQVGGFVVKLSFRRNYNIALLGAERRYSKNEIVWHS